MNFSFFIHTGLAIMVLSVFFSISTDYFQTFNFMEVFAKSEYKNKDFEDSSTNYSSETSTKQKSNGSQSEGKNFDKATQSPSSDTSTTIGNKNKDKEAYMGRSLFSENGKIHPALTHILKNSNPKAIAKIYGATLENEQLFVNVHFVEHTKNIPENIEILGQDQNTIATKLSLNQIHFLAKLDSVKRITLPDFAVFETHGVSEGVAFSQADSLHTAGFNGTGIKVAVIDDNFFINNTEISSNIVHSQLFNSSGTCIGNFSGDISCGETPDASHGTAVAEIVVDMAPGVDLLVYSIGTSIDFSNAVDDAISQGVHIITASLGFPTLGGDGSDIDNWYRDGTSPVAKKVNQAKSNGTLFTVASGNQGTGHWMGTYMPNSTVMPEPLNGDLLTLSNGTGYQSVMIFNASATGAMKACLPVTDKGSTYIASWNAWPTTSTEDYDLMLYNSNMTIFDNGSFSIQNPSGDRPLELFSSALLDEGCLVLASFSNTLNHTIHIDVGSNLLHSSFIVPSGSIDTPADAIGALSVGAIDFNNTASIYSDDFFEIFSSQGPTDDGRLKPEICAPHRTLTHQTGLNPPNPGIFPGTSASTPHVAGAAALLLEQNSNLTADDLKQKLIDDGRFNVNYSVDNKCGSNSGSLQLSLDATITITKTAIGGNEIFDFTTTVTDVNLDGNFTGNSGFTIDTSTSNTVTFTGLSSEVTYTITESPEPGWQFDSLICSGGTTITDITGTTVTLDPDPGEQIDCTYSNTLIPSCTPPGSGDWTITSSCILNSNHTLTSGDVIVQDNSVLTIPNGVTLDIDFGNHNLTVKFGSGVLIKSGGAIT